MLINREKAIAAYMQRRFGGSEEVVAALRALPTVSVTSCHWATAAYMHKLGYTRLEFQLDSTGGHEANYYTQEGAERKALRALPAISVTDVIVEDAVKAFASASKDDGKTIPIAEGIRAALEAALGATVSDGWEDMATAPRDGTTLLLYVKAEGEDADYIITGSYDDGMWTDNARGDWMFRPDKWRPLPDPPSE